MAGANTGVVPSTGGLTPLWGLGCKILGASREVPATQHVVAIGRMDKENTFAKHLANHHPDRKGNYGAFRFTLAEVHRKSLPRLCSESKHIHNNQCEVPMNSKIKWHQPVVARMVVTTKLEELEGQGTRKRACRGTGGRGVGSDMQKDNFFLHKHGFSQNVFP